MKNSVTWPYKNYPRSPAVTPLATAPGPPWRSWGCFPLIGLALGRKIISMVVKSNFLSVARLLLLVSALGVVAPVGCGGKAEAAPVQTLAQTPAATAEPVVRLAPAATPASAPTPTPTPTVGPPKPPSLDLSVPLPDPPPDEEVSVAIGPVTITTYNPVTITGLESATNLYFVARNNGTQDLTVRFTSLEEILQSKPGWIVHFFAFMEQGGQGHSL